MRFLDLHLLAYGPFTDMHLDFGDGPAGLHVLYGRNEAGKSTTLRAVTGLLYGIPARTTDDHVHGMRDLRIGARLGGADGSVLHVVRRKGNVNTLLDPQNKPIDEGALRRMLGGVGEELFRAMFGLDHETLRQGGEELLRGRGNLGESLFGAGLGGAGLRDVLEELEKEADAIFTPLARTRPLNEAIRSFTEAQKKARDHSLSSDAWIKQKQGLEDALAERKTLDAEARALQAQQNRLKRAKRVLPMLARRTLLLEKRAALGEVVRLPDGAAREREEAERQIGDAIARMERLARDIEDVQAKRAALSIPRTLLEQEDAVEDVQSRLGAYRKALADLPRARAELGALQEDARGILRRIRPEATLEGVDRLRVDTPSQGRIKKLALQPAALEEKRRSAERAQKSVESALAEKRARLAGLPPPRDGAALGRAVARAQRQGDLDQRLRKAIADARRLAEVAKGRVSALGLWTGPLAAVSALPVPPIESVDRAESAWSAIAKQRERLVEEAEANERRRADLDRAIDEVQRGGAVPTEEELTATRSLRDETWKSIRKALDAGQVPPSPESYELHVRRADEVSDRLRREATRVANLATLLADREASVRRGAQLATEGRALEDRAKEAAGAWQLLWQPSGIEPLAPPEMRGWLSRHAALSAQVEQLHALELERDTLHRQIDDHKEDLDGLLKAAGEPGLEGSEDLASLVERSARAAAKIEGAAREREELVKAITGLEQEKERLAGELAEREEELLAWREAWARGVVPLGLGAGASPEDATAYLDDLNELFRKVDELKKTERRVDTMERDVAQFEADVEALVELHAPDLDGQPADQAAAQLVRRYREGRQDLAKREQLDRELGDKRREVDEQGQRKAAAEARMVSLRKAARAADTAALEEAERRSHEAQVLERELKELENRLMDAGEGAAIGSLVEEVAGMEADRLAVELDELEGRIDELENRRRVNNTTIGGIQKGLDDLNGASLAAAAAAEAQEQLTRIRARAEQHVRARLAAVVLKREIERYREQNQGPILTRASELFRRLTQGAYAGLKAGFDDKDQAVLRCVRKDAKATEVEVAGLSDGTRDQLFLALRLASLERYAETNEPMPLIVDDILVHFDDERARASLTALGEIAARTQVLFFTHHARLVDLAREAIPAERLREHRLGGS